MRCWSLAACQMSSFDQSAGSGRDGLKNRYSIDTWLPSTIVVGSLRRGLVLTLYPDVWKTVGRETSLCSRVMRCLKVPFPGCRWSIGCS